MLTPLFATHSIDNHKAIAFSKLVMVARLWLVKRVFLLANVAESRKVS